MRAARERLEHPDGGLAIERRRAVDLPDRGHDGRVAGSSPILSRLALGLHDAFHAPRTGAYRWVQGTIWALIVVSIALLITEATIAREHPWGPTL